MSEKIIVVREEPVTVTNVNSPSQEVIAEGDSDVVVTPQTTSQPILLKDEQLYVYPDAPDPESGQSNVYIQDDFPVVDEPSFFIQTNAPEPGKFNLWVGIP